MQITTIVVSPFETNCYLITPADASRCVIIDPGDEDEIIVGKIEQAKLSPVAIFLTHGHGDHIGAVKPLKNKYKIPLYLGRGDESLLDDNAHISGILGYNINCPPADFLVSDRDIITFDSLRFSVLATPGHTPGGVCYLIENHLFCGDTLFSGSIGRTDLPGGNLEQLINSINKSIMVLPEHILCYPGHGPATSVGEEKYNNPFLNGRFA